MKRLMLAIASSLVVASASASGVYGGFSAGNPDLFDDSIPADEMMAGPPEIGSGVNVYRGFSWHPDLMATPGGSGSGQYTGPANVYHGFEKGNPDL